MCFLVPQSVSAYHVAMLRLHITLQPGYSGYRVHLLPTGARPNVTYFSIDPRRGKRRDSGNSNCSHSHCHRTDSETLGKEINADLMTGLSCSETLLPFLSASIFSPEFNTFSVRQMGRRKANTSMGYRTTQGILR